MVECAGLEIQCTFSTYRRFESDPLRQSARIHAGFQAIEILTHQRTHQSANTVTPLRNSSIAVERTEIARPASTHHATIAADENLPETHRVGSS